MFDVSMSLIEMERTIEKELLKEHAHIRILGDLDISQEDYHCLHLKVKGMKTQEQTIGLYESYRLSMLTSWAFGMRYEKMEQVSFDTVYSDITGKPQHMLRMILMIMQDTLREYKLSGFGLRLNTVEAACQLIVLHSGVVQLPESGLYTFMEESIAYSDVNHLDYLYKNVLTPKALEICNMIDNKHLAEYLQADRDAYMDCRLKGMGEKELLKKYPYVSSTFIKNTVRICAALEADGERQAR